MVVLRQAHSQAAASPVTDPQVIWEHFQVLQLRNRRLPTRLPENGMNPFSWPFQPRGLWDTSPCICLQTLASHPAQAQVWFLLLANLILLLGNSVPVDDSLKGTSMSDCEGLVCILSISQNWAAGPALLISPPAAGLLHRDPVAACLSCSSYCCDETL